MKLCIPTLEEALNLLEKPHRFRGWPVCEGSLPPPVMFQRAIAAPVGSWRMPRMFFDEESREIVGSGAFKSEPKDRRVEIGYGVSPLRRRRGYATIGVKLLTEEAFLTGLVDEIHAEVLPTNEPSRRALQKAGFSFSGVGTSDEGQVELWSKRTGPGQALRPTAPPAADL